MSRVASDRELRVYRQALHHAMRVKEVMASFPAEERYDLVPQLRRSSRSVCANLAEAWRRRYYPRAFVAELDDACDRILARLVVMRTRPESWQPEGADVQAGHRGSVPRGDRRSSAAGPPTKRRSGSPAEDTRP